jgi:aminopeptidase
LSAKAHVQDILTFAIGHTAERAAVVVSDDQSGLARIVSRAYRLCLPGAMHVNFDVVPAREVMRSFESLTSGDLVVLVQSTSFRLETFRIRVELFKRGLKVIEHPHLARMLPGEYRHYIDSLAYDPAYYRVVGKALKARIDVATSAVVDSGGAQLLYESRFETAKLNIGDYSEMKNVGGQFPIGEVFTEPRDLESVNGRVRIFVFGDTDFRVNVPDQPITLVVRRGKVIDVVDSTAEFDRVIAQIQADEALWIRELGFGMNRALTRQRLVSDIGTYERMCGIHLSLGAKHGVYNKPALRRKDARYHVDVFAITEQVLLDGDIVYRDAAWRMKSQPS